MDGGRWGLSPGHQNDCGTEEARATTRHALWPGRKPTRLARHLAATRAGLTLDEMAVELKVGRRTAERMRVRDALQAMFPELDYRDDDARVRRWQLPGSNLVGVVGPPAEAVAAIETAAQECEGRGETGLDRQDDHQAMRQAVVTDAESRRRPVAAMDR